MAKPTYGAWAKLKRIGRYLIGRPELPCLYVWQRMPRFIKAQSGRPRCGQGTENQDGARDAAVSLVAQTDSDWASDKVTRKSVNGGALYFGYHLVRSWSKDQSIIALSSAEAELYSANFGTQQAMGLKSFARDLGLELKLSVEIDASAAIGIIGRQGLGKTRHIDTNELWLQQKLKDKEIEISKIPGVTNTADLGTKVLSREVINSHLQRMGYMIEFCSDTHTPDQWGT